MHPRCVMKIPFTVGKIGTWKRNLTVEQNEIIDKWIAENMAREDLRGLEFQYC